MTILPSALAGAWVGCAGLAAAAATVGCAAALGGVGLATAAAVGAAASVAVGAAGVVGFAAGAVVGTGGAAGAHAASRRHKPATRPIERGCHACKSDSISPPPLT